MCYFQNTNQGSRSLSPKKLVETQRKYLLPVRGVFRTLSNIQDGAFRESS